MSDIPNYEARIVKLEANLEAIASRQDEVHHYLRGNGQPGLEARLRAEMSTTVNAVLVEIRDMRDELTDNRINYGKLVGYLSGAGVLGVAAYKLIF